MNKPLLSLIEELTKNKLDCLLLDFCPKGDLYTFLRERGKLPLSLAKNFMSQILNGLDILHNQVQVAHLDLKLENILIEEVRNKE